jgi:hypothetical protein
LEEAGAVAIGGASSGMGDGASMVMNAGDWRAEKEEERGWRER